MYVGLAKLEIWMDGNRELKYKRNILQKIKTRVKNKFNASIAQVDENPDEANFAELGISITGSSSKIVKAEMTKTLNFIESLSLARTVEEKSDIVYFE